MTDSYFNNDDSMPNDAFDESLVSDEEDDDYNAFNSETFGEDTWGGDWEEDHEKMAEIAELNRHHFNDENNELSNKIANFILDDDDVVNKTSHFLGDLSDEELNGEDLQRVPNSLGFGHSVTSPLPSNVPGGQQVDQSQQHIRPKPRPPPGFVENQSSFLMPVELPTPINIKNICTVEELERNLRKPPPTSLRLEDLERNLISSVAVNNMMVRPAVVVRGISRLPGARPTSLPVVRVPQGAPSPTLSRPQSVNLLPPFLPPHPLLLQQNMQNNRGVLPMNNHPQNNVANMQALVPDADVDPFDGFMTYREKQWVASVQISQLSANPTYQNDYYYIMYQHRQSGGRKFNPLKNRDVANSNKNAQYTPKQFENSLGKLQACSVTAPRKIIDMDIVEKTSLDSPTAQPSSSSKKLKQILLEVEQMYTDVLKAEEMIPPFLFALPDPDVDPKALFVKTVNTLLKNDNLSTILNIPKGKALVLRVMSHPEVCLELAKSLLSLLPGVARFDAEQALLRALPSVRHYLQSVKEEELLNLAMSLRPHLHFLLFNKFGISVIANLLECGEALDLSSEDWCEFVSNLGSFATRDSSKKELERPVVGVPAPVLSRLLSRAFPPLCRSHVSLLTRSLATLTSIIESANLPIPYCKN